MLAIVSAVALAAICSGASGNTLVVNGFGVGGWSSWETRTSAGALQIGPNDSSSDAASFFKTSAMSSSDTAIEKQILFMGEGKTVAAVGGQTLPASPAGSLNGLGYVRLDGTGNSLGKSDIGYVDMQGISAASVLNDSSFGLSFRYYSQPYPSGVPRSVGLNLAIVGTDGATYTLTYFQPGAVTGWNTASVSSDSGMFSILKTGQGQLGSNTLQGWAGGSIGTALFGSGAKITRVDFASGQNQLSVVEYLDDAQISFLNGGDIIDFQDPAAVTSVTAAPLPSSAGVGSVLLAVVGGGMVLRRRWVDRACRVASR